MTHQEIFDFVWTKLYEQGEQSTDDFRCKYRTLDGLKCAVGHLIPDDLYEEAMEGHSVITINKNYSLPSEVFNPNNICLLQDLQFAHDFAGTTDFRENLAFHMRDIALRMGLSPAIIEEKIPSSFS